MRNVHSWTLAFVFRGAVAAKLKTATSRAAELRISLLRMRIVNENCESRIVYQKLFLFNRKLRTVNDNTSNDNTTGKMRQANLRSYGLITKSGCG